MRFHSVAILVLACACGRSGFGDMPVSDDDIVVASDVDAPALDFSYLPIIASADGALFNGGIGVASDGAFVFGTSYQNPWNGTAYAGTLVVGDETFPDRASQDEFFLSRWSLDGARQWTQTFGGTSTFYDMRHMHVLADNRILAGLIVSGSIAYAGGTLDSGIREAPVYLLYDPDGVARLGQIEPATGNNAQCQDIAGNGGVLAMIGLYGATVDLGVGNIATALTDPNVFFAVYEDATLALRWARPVDSTNSVLPSSVAVDDGGGTYFSGEASLALDLGGGTITPNSNNVFLAHYDAGGDHVFSMFVNGDSTTANAIITPLPESAGIVTCIQVAAGITIAGEKFTVAGAHDVLVVDYDTSGTPRWAGLFGGAGEDYCNDIALDDSGNVYVGGTFGATMTVGSTTVTADAAGSGFIFSLDPTGAPRWIRAVGGPSAVAHLAVHSASQSVFFHGPFDATVTLDGNSYSGPANAVYVYRWSTRPP